MLANAHTKFRHPSGFSLIEVLITLLILAFGLLGLAGMIGKTNLIEVESYQRSQAILLLSSMSERIKANRGDPTKPSKYISTNVFGTGDASQPTSCTNLPAGTARDQCEWGVELLGASEQTSGTKIGGMTGARGCITQVSAPNPAAGVCTPGVYLVVVAWQGMHQTIAPALACGANLYGADSYRRVVSEQISIGLPSCL